MQMSIRYLNNEIDSLNCCWKQNTSLLWITWHLQLKAGPDAALDEGVREQGCQAMNRPEASAVGWHNDRRGKRGQSIAGLLDQRFGGQPTEVEPADDGIDLLNAGQFLGIAHSIDNVGLFHVLGYQFSPRLTDVGESRFWRMDASADYGVLNGLARQTINRNLIEQNWDDLLRVAGSLKLGTVNVTELLRALQGNGHPSTLAKAIVELGRIAKTLYLLSYIDDRAYRRRILIQLNKGESRHSLARATYFGQKGRCANGIVKGRKSNSKPWGWWSMP
jgi:Tn3 transposase DDE domain